MKSSLDDSSLSKVAETSAARPIGRLAKRRIMMSRRRLATVRRESLNIAAISCPPGS